jgi:hypothetical protein
MRSGVSVRLSLNITQHSRDEQLIRSFVDYFGCGSYYSLRDRTTEFRVTKFSDITEKIIPFFLKYKIRGVKYKSFQD